MESLCSADFILLAEFLIFSSLQTFAAIFQAEQENSDLAQRTGFQGLNKT